MKLLMYITLLNFVVCGLFQGDSNSSIQGNTAHNTKQKRFKDTLVEAKRTAEDNFVDSTSILRGPGQSNVRGRKQNGVANSLDDLEMRKYAKQLETLLKKRCEEWWCGSDKATGIASTTTSAPPQTPPSTTPKKTFPNWSNGWWGLWGRTRK